MNILAPNTVLVTTTDLQYMRKVWPCSGLPYDGYCVSFEFDSNGLCDITWHTAEGIDCPEPEGIDQYCLLALSQDAQVFLTKNDWESRVRALEEEGLTRSDAQAVVDAEDQKANR